MSEERWIVLLGAGGHARACIDVIERHGVYRVAGLAGLENERGGSVLGYPVLGGDTDLPELLAKYGAGIVTLGQIKSHEPRKRLYDLLERYACVPPAVVSPCAYVSSHASIGPGSIVMHGAIINAGARVGRNCIINTMALVEHDSVVEDHCHISTGAILNGAVTIGEGSFIGSRAVVRQGVTVGLSSVIGMGVSVREDCPIRTFTSK